MTSDKLLFVYNATSGTKNAILDYGKKYLQPSTYDCQLCMVSYGPFGMKKDWKKFVASLPYESTFLHKDELRRDYATIKTSYPAVILVHADNSYKVLMDNEAFSSIDSLVDLQEAIKTVLKAL